VVSVDTIKSAWRNIDNNSDGNLFFESDPDWDVLTKCANEGLKVNLEWAAIFDALCLVSGGKRWKKDGDGDVEYLYQRVIKKKKLSREVACLSYLMSLAGLPACKM
jgi:hypothetical protein